MNLGPIGSLLVGVGAITAFVLLVIFVLVPVFRGIGWAIGGVFHGIGWGIMHVVEFIGGMLGDAVRLIGALLAMVVLGLMVPLNVIIGRWSAAGHFAQGVKRECAVGAMCVYRIALRRPLKLLWLHGLLEGIEQRVPEAMAGAPGADKPSRAAGQFDGYTIVGSLRSGGSGARLYIAEPAEWKKAPAGRAMPQQVVIKCFALAEGSGLPQIVRESRALECARELGHVLDHGMDESRFWYVMPYHAGDHLGIVTRQLHAEAGGNGLDARGLAAAMGYSRDLLATLASYHRGGLWHKDVKPENVIIHHGRAHLVDLGLVTSLRSAMTLTTHGTEYFRDPEMVRQALRGVKVHQVNGVKFDVYAVGAVMYFMLENTFPAHGGLSSFAQKSPESLRWIVKRAMTEYQRRYETSDEMLGDLAFVMHAADPFAVKVGELPSVRGQVPDPSMLADASAAVPPAAAAASVAHAPAQAQIPPTPGFSGFGLRAGIDENGPVWHAGKFGAAQPVPAADSKGKSRIRVTNWWTGAYELDSAPAAVESDAQRIMREEAEGYRHDVQQIRAHHAAGGLSTRKAAREQIRAARSRADQVRRRAQNRRAHVMHRRNGPTAAIAIVSLIVALGLVGGGLLMVSRASDRGGDYTASASVRDVLTDAAILAPAPPRVMMVIDPALPRDAQVIGDIKAIMERRSREGFVVAFNDAAARPVATTVDRWLSHRDSTSDREVEAWMALMDVYGLVYVSGCADADGGFTLSDTFLYSTRTGARNRTGKDESWGDDWQWYMDSDDEADAHALPDDPSPAVTPGHGQSLIIVNDHPAKLDDLVEARINRIAAEYAAAHWQIVDEPDVEARVRSLLPVGEWPIDFTPPHSLAGVLEEASLDGVLWIGAGKGEGAPHERVIVQRVMKDKD